MSENCIIKSDEVSKIASGQAVVEARQALGYDCRVLSVSASVYVTPGEVFAGEARYAGKVKFDCIVIHDDKPECVSAVAEFTDKISSPEITAGTAPVLVPEVINAEAQVVDGMLKAIAVVDSALYGVKHCAVECAGEPTEGIYSDKTELEYETAVCEATDTAYISDSMSEVKATEVLFTSSKPTVTKAECADGEVRVSGAVYTDIIVRTEDGLIASYRMITPFVKSASAPDVTEDCKAVAACQIADSAVTFVTDDAGNRIDLSLTLRTDVKAIKKNTATVNIDVFSADNELEVESIEAEVCRHEPIACAIDAVDGQVTLDADKGGADNVLCVTATACRVTAAEVKNGRVNVEGLVSGDIVYYNAEKNAVDCMAFKLPFSMPLAVTTDAEKVDVQATVTDVSVKVRRGSVFDIKAEVAFCVSAKTCDKIKIVKSVECGAPIVRPDATVIVHIAKAGETLWQAAKALGCSPELVQEQNAVTPPYKGGERLVNFNAKK